MLATKKSDCKMQTGFGQIGKIGECGCWTGEPQDLAQNDAQQLPLPVSANRIGIVRIGAQRIETPQILRNGSRLMKGRVPGDICRKLWPADQELASKATGELLIRRPQLLEDITRDPAFHQPRSKARQQSDWRRKFSPATRA